MFFIVLCAALILALTILFKVEAIEVQGISRYSTEEVTEASGLEKGDNLFLADLGAAEKAVESKLPYVKAAHISLSLPDTFVIDVEEDHAAAPLLTKTNTSWSAAQERRWRFRMKSRRAARSSRACR